MDNAKKIKVVVITGPESTGKTWLVEHLSDYFDGEAVFEYAREYISNLNRKYHYSDLEIIAKRQVQDLNDAVHSTSKQILFVDTYLEITKIWFLWKYRHCPDWVDKTLRESDIPLFLLCNTDILWREDNVRENGGENRELLFNQYKTELESNHLHYEIITGTGRHRFENAVKVINAEIL